MTIFEKIFYTLNKEGVKYLVVGGAAVNLYGFRRFTGDLDILLLLTKTNLIKMDRIMKKMGYLERLPVTILDLSNQQKVKNWLKEKNMKAYTFVPPPYNPLQIDIVIEESLKFKDFYKRKIIKSEGGLKIPVIAIQDLLRMKKNAKRDKDMIDLKMLKGIHDL